MLEKTKCFLLSFQLVFSVSRVRRSCLSSDHPGNPCLSSGLSLITDTASPASSHLTTLLAYPSCVVHCITSPAPLSNNSPPAWSSGVVITFCIPFFLSFFSVSYFLFFLSPVFADSPFLLCQRPWDRDNLRSRNQRKYQGNIHKKEGERNPKKKT